MYKTKIFTKKHIFEIFRNPTKSLNEVTEMASYLNVARKFNSQAKTRQHNPQCIEHEGVISSGKTLDQDSSTKGHFPRQRKP
jgi:hypothetical protein